jgi:septal ring factor EnvC (AmiA/AmiB activator)
MATTTLVINTGERTASPSRRISASATDAVARALGSVEAALTDRLDQVQGENAALRQEVVAREARVTELFKTSSAALTAQAATISSLTAQLVEANSKIEQTNLNIQELERRYNKHVHTYYNPEKSWVGHVHSGDPTSPPPKETLRPGECVIS